MFLSESLCGSQEKKIAGQTRNDDSEMLLPIAIGMFYPPAYCWFKTLI